MVTTVTRTESINDEQAALAAKIAAADSAAGAVTAPAAKPEAGDARQHAPGVKTVAMIPKLIGSVVMKIDPNLKAVYSDEMCDEWASAFIETMGFEAEDMPPYVRLAVISLTMAAPTIMSIRAVKAAQASNDAKPQP